MRSTPHLPAASALLRFTTLFLEDGVVPLSAAASRSLVDAALVPLPEDAGGHGARGAGSRWQEESLTEDERELLSGQQGCGPGAWSVGGGWDYELASGWQGGQVEGRSRARGQGGRRKQGRKQQALEHSRLQRSAEVSGRGFASACAV